MLDEKHDRLQQKSQDNNVYTFGRIRKHNVVIACLPGGHQGKSAATSVAIHMMNSFPVKLGLMVGIGGGVPSQEPDIRLGDVVVSFPKDTHGGVVQFNLGKMETDGFRRKGHLDKPPRALLGALTSLSAKHEIWEPEFPNYLSVIAQNPRMAKKYGYQGLEQDRLFDALEVHPRDQDTCDECASNLKIIERDLRADNKPQVFYGTIGSGDLVMKNGEERDKKAAVDKVLCFEMEAAGLMNDYPCLVIRGISDYSDSHKNDRWQPYAAATAAAYAKELLGEISVQEVEELAPAHIELLRWMSSVNFYSIHEHIREKWIPGTGQWLLDHPEYREWRSSSSSSMLLLHGVPGCGKTVLSSVVIESLRAERRSNPSIGAFAYFYCANNENERERRSSKAILRSIVRQLTTSGSKARRVLASEYQRRRVLCENEGVDLTRPRIDDCMRLVLDVAVADPITIILDGLDEVDENHRHDLLKSLSRIVSDSRNVAKVFATSRDHSQIFSSLSKSVHICIQSQNNHEDVEKFIRYSLTRLRDEEGLRISPEVEDKIVKILIKRSGEMFLWIEYQLNRFRLGVGITAEQILDKLRTAEFVDLDAIYADKVSKLFDNDEGLASDVATQTISWILYAKEPLSLETLNTAFASRDITITTVLRQCSNLVVFDHHSNVFRIAHMSVQDFLLKHAYFSDCLAHNRLARTCLVTCNKGPPQANTSAKSLYEYGAVYWAYHYRKSNARDQDEDLKQCMQDFVLDEDGDLTLSFLFWLDACKQIALSLAIHHPQKLVLEAVECLERTSLFTACIYDLDDLLDSIASLALTYWDQTNKLGQTGIYLAAAIGNDRIVEGLIKYGADPDYPCGKHGSALAAACFTGHLNIVQRLIHVGASLKPTGVYGNALEAAIRGDKEHVALYLLQKVYKDLDQDLYDTAMLGASKSGWTMVFNYLMKPTSLITNEPGRHIQDPGRLVRKAIQRGQTESLRMLLSANTNLSTAVPHDGISHAVLHGHIDMIDLLVRHGLSLEEEGQLGSPLRVASLLAHQQIAQIIIGKGAEVNTVGRWGTALQAAAMKGHLQMVQLLLDAGANPKLTGGEYGNCLQAASYHGHNDVVELLLEAGADVHQDGFFRDAFHAAVEGGNRDVLKTILLKPDFKFYAFRGSVPSFKMHPPSMMHLPSRYRDLLRDASPSHTKDYLTLTPGKNVGSRQQTPHETSSDDSSDIALRLAFEPDPPIRVKDEHRNINSSKNCALIAAASKGHETVVAFFLEQRDILKITKAEIMEAFEKAATQGYTRIVELFLRNLLDVTCLSLETLCLAAAEKHVSVVEAILGSSMGKYIGSREIRAMLCSGSEPLVRRGLDLPSRTYPSVDGLDLRRTALLAINKKAEPPAIGLLLDVQPSIDAALAIQVFDTTCCSGNLTVVQILWNRGCREFYQNQSLKTCLIATAAQGHEIVLGFLLEQIDCGRHTAVLQECIAFAAGNGHLEAVTTLHRVIERLHSSNDILTQALIVSSEAGHPSVVAFLVSKGALIDHVVLLASRLLHFRHEHSWKEGSLEQQDAVLDILLQAGAAPNFLGGCPNQPIIRAATWGTISTLRALIEHGADVDGFKGEDCALVASAGRETSSLTLVKELLEAGASLSTVVSSVDAIINKALSFFGNGCFLEIDSLQYVFDEGPGAVVMTLLAKFPYQRALDKRYSLILQMASFLNRHRIVELLLERGTDVNAAGHYYGTALQAASRCGHLKLVRQLLVAGADVNTLEGEHHTALRAAVTGGHLSVVELLVENGADLGLKFEYTQSYIRKKSPSLFEVAVKSSNLDVLGYLIRAGVKAIEEELFEHQEHPLTAACSRGDLAMARLVVGAGVSANMIKSKISYQWMSDKYDSPLNKACSRGHYEVVQFLIASGADVENEEYWNPLVVAADAGHPRTVQLLLSIRVRNNHEIAQRAILEASWSGHAEVVAVLLRHRIDTHHLWAALFEAIDRHHARVVELLIAFLGASDDPNKKDHIANALESAGRTSDKVFQPLLAHAPLNSHALICACNAGSLYGVKLCLEQGVLVDSEDRLGRRGLHVAAYRTHVAVVLELLSHGANANHIHPWYGSPLVSVLEGSLRSHNLVTELKPGVSDPTIDTAPHSSIEISNSETERRSRRGNSRERLHIGGHVEGLGTSYGQPTRCEEIVRHLFRYGAVLDLHIRPFGNALHIAAYMGHASLVQLLLSRGANINTSGGYFHNALFAALQRDHVDTAILLLKRFIDVRSVDDKGTTPLHIACSKGHIGLISHLIRAGADVNARNDEGRTPWKIALRRQLPDTGNRRSIGQSVSVLDTLLRNDKGIVLSEKDLIAASEQSTLHNLFCLLSYDKDIKVPEKIITDKLAESYVAPENLLLLLERSACGVTESMFRNAHNPHSLEVLLRHDYTCKITSSILEAQQSGACFKLLFAKDESVIPTESVVLAMLRAKHEYQTSTVLEDIWKRNPSLNVTSEMLETAEDPGDLDFLLSRSDLGR